MLNNFQKLSDREIQKITLETKSSGAGYSNEIIAFAITNILALDSKDRFPGIAGKNIKVIG